MLVCKVSLGKARLSWFYKNKYFHKVNTFSYKLKKANIKLGLQDEKESYMTNSKETKLKFCQILLHFNEIQGKGISSSRQNSK